MRIQTRFLLLVSICLLVVLSALTWKLNSIWHQEIEATWQARLDESTSMLARLAQSRLTQTRTEMIDLASSRENSGHLNLDSTRFQALVLLQNKNGVLTPKWSEARAGESFDKNLLAHLPTARVQDGDTIWSHIADLDGHPGYAYLASVELANSEHGILLALSSQNDLGGTADDWIGSGLQTSLIDTSGAVAAHTDKNYENTVLSEDPLVKEVIASRASGDLLHLQNARGKAVWTKYLRVAHSGLLAMATVSVSEMQAPLRAQSFLIWQVGGGIALIGVLLTFFFMQNLSQSLQRMRSEVQALLKGQRRGGLVLGRQDEIGFLAQDIEKLAASQNLQTSTSEATILRLQESATAKSAAKASELSEQAAQQASLSAQEEIVVPAGIGISQRVFEQWGRGLTVALKSPLMAILGHAQLAVMKADSDEARTHASAIEKEARRAKRIIEKLTLLDGERSLDIASSEFDLKQQIEIVLNKIANQVEEEKIKIDFQAESVPSIQGWSTQVGEAIMEVCLNAIEALSDRPDKKIEIRLSAIGPIVQLMVKDFGIGMSRDVRDRAFDPFFSGFSTDGKSGLGLAIVRSICARHRGEVSISSTPGNGTMVILSFPAAEVGLVNSDLQAEPLSIATEASGAFLSGDIASLDFVESVDVDISDDDEDDETEKWSVPIRAPRAKGLE
jgi:signal transduction histidine kinase